MDKLEKSIFIVSSFLLVIFICSLLYATFGMGIKLPTCVTSMRPFSKGAVIEKAPGKYEIHIMARMWSFDPELIELPLNAEVEFYITTPDVMHGFQIVNTNVNLMAVPGTVNFAQHKFSKSGDYLVLCHEYCGIGHQNMAATIRVKG